MHVQRQAGRQAMLSIDRSTFVASAVCHYAFTARLSLCMYVRMLNLPDRLRSVTDKFTVYHQVVV